MTNFYNILEVTQDADETTIKKSYRALSLKYHPDRNPNDPGATHKFQEINEAYEHLSDPQRRAQHDAELNGFPQGEIHIAEHDLGNIFNMMFAGGFPGMPGMPGMPEGIHVFHMGGGGMQGGGGFGPHHFFRQMQKPPSIMKNVEITLDQAYFGCTLHVTVEKWRIQGDLKINENEVVYLNIPPGADHNEVIIMRDCGNVAREDLKGDVKFIVSIKNETAFTRHGMDLIYKKSLTLKEALTGFTVEIPHISGKLLALNNKTNSTIIHPNYKKVIPGLGMMRDSNKGNLIIEFDVSFPSSLTPEQITALEQIL
jgi:DnaJ-class molecular chaperone